MNPRRFWRQKIQAAWKTRPVVWLSGVRRVGKTSLARQIPGTVFLNCDLASAVRRLEDPERFFQEQRDGQLLVIDEIHRLPDPSNLLKVAADQFPRLRILATGSSTLAATRKFRDSLTGRKWALYLPPVLWDECRTSFGVRDLDRRLLHGGLPEPLLAATKAPDFFAEWMDSYYARDISDLFGVRDRTGFLNLLRLFLCQSGGLVDVSKLASEAGVSRQTVKAHAEAMAVAHAIFLLPPFHGGGRREIVHRPKVYAFDTGFVTFARSWDTLRDDDRGGLWEHLVLDSLRATCRESSLAYWRDKSGREVDFVIRREGGRVDAVECKIQPGRCEAEIFRHFRSLYPRGENWVITPMEHEAYTRDVGGVPVRFLSTRQLFGRGPFPVDRSAP